MTDIRTTLKIESSDEMASKVKRKSKVAKYTEEIVKLYLEGETLTQLGVKFNVSRHTITSVVRRGTANIRSKAESALLRHEKSTVEQRKNQTLIARKIKQAMSVIDMLSW